MSEARSGRVVSVNVNEGGVPKLPVDEQWTHYYAGEDEYRQLDYVLISRALAEHNPQALPHILRKGLPWRASRYAGARFKELRHVQSRATSAGYRVQGGTAVCRMWESGATIVASVWIGDGDPGYETETSDLSFADAAGETVPTAAVPPVAWSEGLRMAATLHAGRVVDEEKDR